MDPPRRASMPGYFHHTLTYPDGTRFAGKLDHSTDVPIWGLEREKVAGKSVLDVACNDGFWAFWSEMQGAAPVVAFDVGRYEQYDWGPSGPPAGIDQLRQQNKWEAFDFHHSNLRSSVRKVELSVYDVRRLIEQGYAGSEQLEFDIVFHYGLIYHLRNPMLALDELRRVTRGVMLLESQVLPLQDQNPFAYWCGAETGLLGVTDYWWPTESCIVSWLVRADFGRVFVQRHETQSQPTRQRFAACLTPEWAEHFAAQPAFFEVTEPYWQKVRIASRFSVAPQRNSILRRIIRILRKRG